MALLPITRLAQSQRHLRDTLRDHLPGFIIAANVELTALGEDTIDAIADTTAQIELGDHRDYEPEVYPSIRVSFPQTRFVRFESGNNLDSENIRLLGLYLEAKAGSGECAGDVVKALHNSALVYLESIRGALEKHLPEPDDDGVCYGDRLDLVGFESIEDDTPQDPDDPCTLRIKYEITLEWWMRVRHSRNA